MKLYRKENGQEVCVIVDPKKAAKKMRLGWSQETVTPKPKKRGRPLKQESQDVVVKD